MINQRDERLTARQAAALLGVKLPTLYAYVSRGLLRSVSSDERRSREYLRSEVEELRARRRRQARGGPAAAGALRFGEPVLDSSITSMSQSGPSYRGHPAIELAAADTPFESVAELLWSGRLPESPPDWGRHGFGVAASGIAALLPEEASPLSSLTLVVAALAARDRGRFDRREPAVLARARAL
ncbi:MAG: helix-turn-helix domain-containing protein, partial [Candidatus Binatia bacterium]